MSKIDRLFEGLKNSPLMTTLKTGRVKIRAGATFGDWAEMGRMIDPTAERPIEVAEAFFYHKPKDAKYLRERIAAWREANVPILTPMVYIEGDCFHEHDHIGPVDADHILIAHTSDRSDAADWSVMDDITMAGIRVVQIGECVEGETRKYMWRES